MSLFLPSIFSRVNGTLKEGMNFFINCGVYSFEVAKANGDETDFSKLSMSDLLLVQYNNRQHYFTTHHHFSSFMLTDTSDVLETGRLVRDELNIVMSFFNSLTDNRKLLDWFMKEKVWVHHNKFLIYAFQQGYWDYVDYFIKNKKKVTKMIVIMK
jgi:hypothetical protein